MKNCFRRACKHQCYYMWTHHYFDLTSTYLSGIACTLVVTSPENCKSLKLQWRSKLESFFPECVDPAPPPCQLSTGRMICFALPRGSVKNNMTRVALRGRGTTSAYNCFPATSMFSSNLKFFASVKGARLKPHVCSLGALCFGDTHANGGSSDKHGYMAFLILAKWEWQVKDLCCPDNAPC